MNLKPFMAAALALCAVAFSCSKKEAPVDPEPVEPIDTVAAAAYVNVPLYVMSFDAEAAETEFSIYSNYAVVVNCDANWLKLTSGDEPAYEKHGLDTLEVVYSMKVEANESTEARSATIEIVCQSKTMATISISQDAKEEDPVAPTPVVSAEADILDVEFLPDGTAKDISGSGITFSTIAGSRLSTYYNEDYKRYAAHFNTYPAGGSVPSGYYKADYTSSTDLKNKIADGHSIEMVVRLDCNTDGGYEIKAMCSQQSGGTGIMVSASGYGKCLTFLPNVSTNGASTWRWATSGVVPSAGRYYHIVGVWDKEAGKAYVYVDGELKKTVDAGGSFNFAQSGGTWFCVGGDAAGASAAESGWWGDIVIARVYDSVLGADKIADLWKASSVSAADNFILTGLDWSAAANVSVGCKLNVFGSGFASGDVVRLVSSEGLATDCTTTIASDHVSAEIPSGFVSGDYTILIVRGSQVYSVGRTVLTVSDEAVTGGSVKCVAHRGYHPDSAHPENSIASLKYAQELGAYGSEFDVWETTDGGLFINHDGVLSGVTIYNSTTAQVENLTLSNGEKIPTLRQYLEQGKKVPSVKMILELKHELATEKSLALVKEMGMEDQVEWISFSYSACKKVRAALPNAVVQYLGGDITPSSVAADKLSAIDYAYTTLTSHPEWIKQAHDAGLFVNVWTVDSDFASWIAQGVDVITTNQSKALLESLSRTYVEK